ncbi:hypothetical protein [Mucilaginibacter pedocola]|uniref:Uncharacterized protein n=1 Tax=Mucilaginibacter pedocola TaxID=1792845 RepID=A0A1S9PL53_9SPHI|nr:hypothetical protein [Mucilaginibacter pedocola]OOQ61677.1 hypothetical protein BC343_00975 [Mucilaginibacter pedocola]
MINEFVLESIAVALMVLLPLAAVLNRNPKGKKIKRGTIERSNYVVNEYGKLELLTHEGEEQE